MVILIFLLLRKICFAQNCCDFIEIKQLAVYKDAEGIYTKQVYALTKKTYTIKELQKSMIFIFFILKIDSHAGEVFYRQNGGKNFIFLNDQLKNWHVHSELGSASAKIYASQTNSESSNVFLNVKSK